MAIVGGVFGEKVAHNANGEFAHFVGTLAQSVLQLEEHEADEVVACAEVSGQEELSSDVCIGKGEAEEADEKKANEQ